MQKGKGMGLSTALSEITLVLFTTLAPSGALAICVMAVLLLMRPGDAAQRRRLEKFLYIPLIATMAGLVASATHLGNPSNALYAFLGVGTSPLSNEVFAAVCFLALTGIYWFCSFLPLRSAVVRRAWLVAIVATGAAFVWTVAFAYDAPPIVTWHMPTVPLALFANACVGGPLLVAMTLRIARWGQSEGAGAAVDAGAGAGGDSPVPALYTGLAWASVAGIGLSAIVYAVQGVLLGGIQNYVAAASQLVPGYWGMLAAYVALCALGVFFSRRAARRCVGGCDGAQDGRADDAQGGWADDASRDERSPLSGHRRIAGDRPCFDDVAALACAFCGIFVMRFAFYMMHMSAGMGL